MQQQGNNSPLTTALAVLLVAAAALCGICSQTSFEGQGPMQLEALATTMINKRPRHPGESQRHPGEGRDLLPSPIIPIKTPLSNNNGIHTSDWSPLIPMLSDTSRPITERAAIFHLSMAHTLLQQAQQVREQPMEDQVYIALMLHGEDSLMRECTKRFSLMKSSKELETA